MKTKTLAGAALCVGTILGLGSGAVMADGHTGAPDSNAERGNGRSICTFSGQNDDPDEPGGEGRVQSFGQIVKQYGGQAVAEMGAAPAAECNPNNAPWGDDIWWREVPRKGGGK